ncbi:hypothetical protein V7S43_015814 [Phytophthora oleae]|uniref:Uncharacterized protein n=1 Tax=Phytophthora oleae TaxID=2107226 RepID=A0ABD3EYE8_9STRA
MHRLRDWLERECAQHVHTRHERQRRQSVYQEESRGNRRGAFPEGGAVIRKVRALNNIFASSRSPERIAKLKEAQTFYNFFQLGAMVDIDVRIASTVKLFRRSIVNYPAFNAYFQRADLTKSEKAVFTSITMAEWELVVQLEAVV